MAHVRSRHTPEDDLASLRPLVDEWVVQRIISPEQAQRMLAAHPAGQVAHVRSRSSYAVEAAGYLGGCLVVVATILIAAQYWRDLSTAVRSASVGGAALALLVAGSLITGHAQKVGDRLVAVLWLASSAATAGFLAIVADAWPTLDGHEAPSVATGTAAYAGALWCYRRFLVLQIATMVAVMVAVGTTVADLSAVDSLPAFGVWVVAAIWLALGWAGRLGPPRAVKALGAAAMVVGAIMAIPTTEGFVLALGTLAAVAALGVARREPLLLGVAALGSLQVLPAIVVEWFPDSSLAPFILLVAGVVTVGVAVWAAARGGRPPAT